MFISPTAGQPWSKAAVLRPPWETAAFQRDGVRNILEGCGLPPKPRSECQWLSLFGFNVHFQSNLYHLQNKILLNKVKTQANGWMNGFLVPHPEINKLVHIIGLQIQKSDGKEARWLSIERSKSERFQILFYLYLSRMEFSHDHWNVYIKSPRPIFS